MTNDEKIIKILKSIKKEIEELNDRLDVSLGDKFECQQCGEIFELDEMGGSELALNDGICKYCMSDGYGE